MMTNQIWLARSLCSKLSRSTMLLMIEFDGTQHFKPCIWKPTLSDVQKGQDIDYEKMCLAYSYGYRVIRFDYTWGTRPIAELTAAVELAIQTLGNNHTLKLWVSDKAKYDWLTNRFDANEWTWAH
jgi:hypothetical protein